MQVGLNLKGNYTFKKILSNISLKIHIFWRQLCFLYRVLRNPQTPMTQPQTLTLKESNEGDNKLHQSVTRHCPRLINSISTASFPVIDSHMPAALQVSNHFNYLRTQNFGIMFLTPPAADHWPSKTANSQITGTIRIYRTIPQSWRDWPSQGQDSSVKGLRLYSYRIANLEMMTEDKRDSEAETKDVYYSLWAQHSHHISTPCPLSPAEVTHRGTLVDVAHTVGFTSQSWKAELGNPASFVPEGDITSSLKILTVT